MDSMRLSFYSGTGSYEERFEADVVRVLDIFRAYRPTVISLAYDPEGAGPDTHFKVLSVIAESVKRWREENSWVNENVRIMGYRNVWFTFDPSEADIMTPVSLNSIATLNTTFHNCYLSQVDASYPSYQLDGPFSHITQKTYVNQLSEIQLLLGKDFFYQNANPRLRNAHGMLYYRMMSPLRFVEEAAEMANAVE